MKERKFMELKRVLLRNFRNYVELGIELEAGAHIFLGRNGAGKTNLIEALEILSTCRSHRTKSDADMIRSGEKSAFLEAEYERYGVRGKASVLLQRRQGRVMSVGASKVSFSDFIGNIKTVLFSPDDLMLAKGAPGLRRAFLDREICQANKVYLGNLMRYNGILRERNALLKVLKEGRGDGDMLEIYDTELSKYASAVVSKRKDVVKKLSDTAAKMVEELSEEREKLEIVYSQEYEEMTLESDFFNALQKTRDKDIHRGYTGIGPHIDDLTFIMNSMSLKNYASQGQQRTAVLAAKLSEVSFLTEQTEEPPILLLDDVLSELDENRRGKLLDYVTGNGITAFLTATDSSYIPPNIGIRHIVRDGKIG